MKRVSLFGVNLGVMDDTVVISSTNARLLKKAAGIYTEYVDRAIVPSPDEHRATGKLALYGAIMDAMKAGYAIGRTS